MEVTQHLESSIKPFTHAIFIKNAMPAAKENWWLPVDWKLVSTADGNAIAFWKALVPRKK